MRRQFVKYAIAVLVVWVFALTGCQRIPLYERTVTVRVMIDHYLSVDEAPKWSVPTELDAEFLEKINGKMPDFVEVLFYETESHKLIKSHILPAEGGLVNVPVGDYSIVIYNFGTGSTQVGGLDYRHKVEAYTTDITKQISSKLSWLKSSTDTTKAEMKGYEDDSIIYEPDHLYVANEPKINIPSFVEQTEFLEIHTNSRSIVEVYSLEVLGIKGAENIEKVEAFITGQIKSNYFGIQKKSIEPATIYTDMKVDVTNRRLYTLFGTFGKQPGEDNNIYLDITVTDSGGGQYRYVFDVTDQFDDPENIDNSLIIDATEIIDIPDAEHGGGGLQPSVDPWEREDIDVPLG